MSRSFKDQISKAEAACTSNFHNQNKTKLASAHAGAHEPRWLAYAHAWRKYAPTIVEYDPAGHDVQAAAALAAQDKGQITRHFRHITASLLSLSNIPILAALYIPYHPSPEDRS